jgi:hypothetical protein
MVMGMGNKKDKYTTLQLTLGLIGRPAMSHLRTETSQCVECQRETEHDHFELIVGDYVGVGAPWFVALFLKRSSTKGKIPHSSAIKGRVSQCSECLHVNGEDDGGREICGSI